MSLPYHLNFRSCHYEIGRLWYNRPTWLWQPRTIQWSLQEVQERKESYEYGEDLRSFSSRHGEHPRYGASQCTGAQPGNGTNLLCARAGVYPWSLNDGRPGKYVDQRRATAIPSADA